MQRVLRAIVLALLLSAPATSVAQPQPDPDLQAAVDATTDAAAGAVEDVNATLAALQSFVKAVQGFDPSALDEIPPPALEAAAMLLVEAGVGVGERQGGVLLSVATLLAITGLDTASEVTGIGMQEALVTFDQSIPQGPLATVLRPLGQAGTDGLPVAALRDGRYTFELTLVNTTSGADAPYGEWRLEILGLQVLPHRNDTVVPGIGSMAKPVAVLTELYEAEAERLNGAILIPDGCGDGCATISVPAGPLKLERLYAGGMVLARFTPDVARPTHVGWHSALANLAVEAAAQEPPPTKVALSLADLLDQIPTPILLAPQVEFGRFDADNDTWDTAVEVSLNSDPFDEASRPGLDDDGDGVLNYLEASRAAAVNFTSPEFQADVRAPLAGVALISSELGPRSHDFVPSRAATLTSEVLDLGVAGPPRFFLEDLTLNLTGPLRAAPGKELQSFTLFRATGAGAEPIRTWFLDASGTWTDDAPEPDPAPECALLAQVPVQLCQDPGPSLVCEPVECRGADTVAWTLRHLDQEVEHAAKFLVHATLAPQPLPGRAASYDHSLLGLEADPKGVVVRTGVGTPPPVGPRQFGPLHQVNVLADQLRTAASPIEAVAGVPVPLGFCAVDGVGNQDHDVLALRLAYAAGGLPSPAPSRTPADPALPANFTTALGCLAQDIKLHLATADETLVAATAAGLPEVRAPGITVVPAPLDQLRVALPADPATDGAPLDIVRVRTALPAALEEGYDLATLEARGVDAFDNPLAAVDSAWTPSAGLPGLAPATGARYAASSAVGGIAGDVCAASGALQACAGLRFRGRTGPSLAFPSDMATCNAARGGTGADHAVCIEVDDDVPATLNVTADLVRLGATEVRTTLDLTRAGPTRWTASFPLPQDSLDAWRVEATASDGEKGFLVKDRPAGGEATAALPVGVDDVILPKLTIVPGEPHLTGPLRVRGNTPLTITATDNLPGALAPVAKLGGRSFTGANGALVVRADDAGLNAGAAQMIADVRDAAGNVATATLNLAVDDLAPATVPRVDGPFTIVAGTFVLANDAGRLVLAATDAPTSGAGVASITHRVGTGNDDPTNGAEATVSGLNGVAQQVCYHAEDALGNVEPERCLSALVDAKPPTVDILAPLDAAILRSQPTLRVTITDEGLIDLADVRVFVRGQKVVTGLSAELVPSPHTLAIPITGLVAGTNLLRVEVLDAGARKGSDEVTVTLDADKPTIAIASPAAGAFLGSGEVPVRLVVDDDAGLADAKLSLTLDTTHAVDLTNATRTLSADGRHLEVSLTLRGLAHGAHALVAGAEDSVGAIADAASAPFTVDLTDPVIEVLAPTATLLPTAAPDIVLRITDDLSPLVPAELSATLGGSALALDIGGSGTELRASATASALEDGVHALWASARNAAGRAASFGPHNLTLDTTRPTIAITSPAAGAGPIAFREVAVAFRIEDNLGIDASSAEVRLGNQLVAATITARAGGLDGSLTLRNLADGAYELTVKASDRAGNPAVPATRGFTVDATRPVAILTAPGDGAFLKGTVPIRGTASREGQALQEWRLEVSRDGGATWAVLERKTTGLEGGTFLPWNTAFETDGPKTLRLTVTSASGLVAQDAITGLRVDNTAPVLSAIAGDAAHDAAGTWSRVGATRLTWSVAEQDLHNVTCTIARASEVLPVADCRIDGAAFDAPTGPATFRLDALDKAGNAAVRATFPLRVDSEAPSITGITAGGVASGDGKVKEGEQIRISATVRDLPSDASLASGLASVKALLTTASGKSEVSLGASGSAYSAVAGPFAFGSIAYELVARDGAGNEARTAPASLNVVDLAPPTLRLLQPAAATADGPIAVKAQLADTGSGVAEVAVALRNAAGEVVASRTSLAGAGLFTLDPPLSVSGLANGPYALSVEARDASGNRAWANRSIALALEPTLGDPVASVADRNVTITVAASGTPALKVWLYPTLREEVLGRMAMEKQDDGTWTRTLGPADGVDHGDLVTYFVEARDGSVSLRTPRDGSLRSVDVPIPETSVSDLDAWSGAATGTLTGSQGESEGHGWVNITRAQFTQARQVATFALEVQDDFPVNGTLPRYRVEFRLDPGSATPDLVLQATYSPNPQLANWNVQALDGGDQPLGGFEPLTVVPDLAERSVVIKAEVDDLRARFGASSLARLEVRFRALGSDVFTVFRAFDLEAPAPRLTPPASLPETANLTSALGTALAATDNLPLAEATARLEVTVNDALTVLPVPVVGGMLQLPDLSGIALAPGVLNLTLTVVDDAGNAGATLPQTVTILDSLAPELGAATLDGKLLAEGAPVQVAMAADLDFRATLTDAAGLPAATLTLPSGDAPPLVAAGDAFGLAVRFPRPGPQVVVLQALDATGNLLRQTFPVDVLDTVAPSLGAPALRLPGADGPSLPELEAGQPAVLSIAATDDGPLDLLTLRAILRPGESGPAQAPGCVLAMTPRPGGVFEAALPACDLPLGPFTLEVEALDFANVAKTAPLSSLLQDHQPPVLTVTGVPAQFNDREASGLLLTVRAEEQGRLVDLQAFLERPDLGVRQSLLPFREANREHRVRLPEMFPGAYRLVVEATDQEFVPGLGVVRRTVTVSQALLVDDALPPLLELVAPRPGDVTPSERVLVSGAVLDARDVKPETFALTIDGVPQSAVSLTPFTEAAGLHTIPYKGLRFAQDISLPRGRHVMSLQAADAAGNVLTSTWAFYVIDQPVGLVVQPRTAAAATSSAPAEPSLASQSASGAAAGGLPEALVRTNVQAAPPPVIVSVPALAAEATSIVTLPATGIVRSLAVKAEAPVEDARIVTRELAPAEEAAHDFGALFRQVEINVQQGPEVAPVVLEHIDFSVPRSFVDGQGLDPREAVLLHLEQGDWAERTTNFMDADADFYHYRAQHGGRSTFAIVFDRAPPVVELLAPAIASIGDFLSLEAIARDDTRVKDLVVTLNGAVIGSGAPLLRLTIDASTIAQITSGSLVLAAEAKDASGKTGRATQTVVLQARAAPTCAPGLEDGQPPTTTVAWQGGEAALFGDILGIKGPVRIRFSATDAGPAGCRDAAITETRYRVDEGPLLAGLSVDIAADARHTLEYFSVDSKGNQEAARTLSIVPAEGARQVGEFPEPLEAPPKGVPGLDALLVLGVLALAGLARRRRA